MNESINQSAGVYALASACNSLFFPLPCYPLAAIHPEHRSQLFGRLVVRLLAQLDDVGQQVSGSWRCPCRCLRYATALPLRKGFLEQQRLVSAQAGGSVHAAARKCDDVQLNLR